MYVTVGSYRLNSETIGLQRKDGRLVSVMVPQGAILVVGYGSEIKREFIECTWNEQELMVFAVDLLQRGERLKQRLAASA